ncbi:alpha/beta fold hydrolase [Actinocrispum sp. NPDC049592]|uniref:alpha/beta fold hydrolase n=1 Tax=Actinocrispum sp. NPDC049592 TaxID=3154835 RepID=UPI003415CE50
MRRDIPLYTLAGVTDAEVSTRPFTTVDGLGLSLLRFRRGEAGEVVLLVPGLTLSSDMFIMPEHYNLVSFLLDNGFEVWSLDSRMSNRHPYGTGLNRYTLDDLALFDHPAAVSLVRGQIGDRPLHVVSHCLGAVSFLMALFAGTVDGITSVVANSVGLTPRVATWSMAKLAAAPFLAEYVLGMPTVTPDWARDPAFTRGWAVSKLTSLLHRECDVPECHLLSFLWGTGWPAMYEHENLLPVTHRRIGDLCRTTGFSYDRHVRKMVLAGRAVKYRNTEKYSALPDDYLARAAEVTTPLLLMSGDRNKIFGASNRICFDRLEKAAPGRHEYATIPGYGHIDPFIGQHAAVEVFPRMLDFLKRQGVSHERGTR